MASWREEHLHAWLTLLMLFGRRFPSAIDDRTPDLSENERKAFIYDQLHYEAGGERRVVDPRGVEVILNDRLTAKMLQQPDRTPYIPWIPHGIQHALEIWQKTETAELRNYYMVPLVGSKSKEGFVVIAGADNVAFNSLPFNVAYADAKLRHGDPIFKAYPEQLLCDTDCCERIAENRKQLRGLELENRELQRKLTQLRYARTALRKELAQLKGGE